MYLSAFTRVTQSEVSELPNGSLLQVSFKGSPSDDEFRRGLESAILTQRDNPGVIVEVVLDAIWANGTHVNSVIRQGLRVVLLPA